MGCSCDKIENCDNGTECVCGIVLKLTDSSGALVDTLEGTGYIDFLGKNVYQFQSGVVFPTGVLTMKDETMVVTTEHLVLARRSFLAATAAAIVTLESRCTAQAASTSSADSVLLQKALPFSRR